MRHAADKLKGLIAIKHIECRVICCKIVFLWFKISNFNAHNDFYINKMIGFSYHFTKNNRRTLCIGIFLGNILSCCPMFLIISMLKAYFCSFILK